MPYARMDDRYDDHRKIKRAWRREPAAVALHTMAITYSNRHTSDGEIDVDWIEEKLALLPYSAAKRRAVVDLLLELNLLEVKDEETYIVHDFLDWNLSAAKRRSLAEQGRKGGQSRWGSSEQADGGSSQGHSQGLPKGLSTPTPAPTPTKEQGARARRASTRRVDQTEVPDELPDHLTERVLPVLRLLTDIWDIRGGVQPQERGVALGMMRNPDVDHVAVARKLQHWLTAGKGQRSKCADIAARFGDWVADEVAGTTPTAAQGTTSALDAERMASFDRLKQNAERNAA